MGRPLKIKNASVPLNGIDVDAGFNPFDQLTSPVIPNGMTGTEFLGAVGGGAGLGTPQFPVVTATANLYGTEDNAQIITQKGETKYQVALETGIPAGNLIPGRTYLIAVLGNTNWQAVGASINATEDYDVFTATGAGSGTGTALEVGTAALANQSAGNVTQGNMQITMETFHYGNIQVGKLTNKYVWSYTSGEQYLNDRYAVNFFANSGVTQVLANVTIVDTAGEFLCDNTTLAGGDMIRVSGTPARPNAILGYVDPSTYTIVGSNGVNDFTLGKDGGGTLDTFPGNTTGLTFTYLSADSTLKSGAEIDTFENTTGELPLAIVQNET